MGLVEAVSQTFTVKGQLPSLNDVTRANRTHWAVGAKQKAEAESRIGWYIREAKLKPVSGPCHVQIAWHEPNRRRDIDNVTSAVKFVLDALVKQGILPDDSQAYVSTITHLICIDYDKPRVEVTLAPVEEG